MIPSPRGRGLAAPLAAGALCAISIAIRWPGVAMYDSVGQYEQALDGDYADWHPPVMARAWALLNHLHAGTQPFFLIQMLLWWGGLGLISAALARRGRRTAAGLVLLVGAAPLFLGWTTVVLKDAQMACCLVAAAGVVAHWRLAGRPLPFWTAALALALIGYATLVRGNAVFASVPLACALFAWGGIGRPWPRAGLVAALMLAVIALSSVINHRLLGATASHVERALPLYDLAGIAHDGGLATLPHLPPAAWAAAERRGCYTPYFWNPYGQADQCEAVGDVLAFDAPAPHLMRDWAEQVARHPLAYAVHRLSHLNDNLRFWVGPGEPDAMPPVRSEPNGYGLGAPASPPGRWLIAAAGVMLETPLGWPCVWLATSVALLWAGRGDAAQARLGRALALSAACMSMSFAVVSIASDLRYHLWSMVAAALALVLIADAGALDRRRLKAGTLAVAAVALLGIAARLGLAAPVDVPLPPHGAPPAGTEPGGDLSVPASG